MQEFLDENKRKDIVFSKPLIDYREETLRFMVKQFVNSLIPTDDMRRGGYDYVLNKFIAFAKDYYPCKVERIANSDIDQMVYSIVKTFIRVDKLTITPYPLSCLFDALNDLVFFHSEVIESNIANKCLPIIEDHLLWEDTNTVRYAILKDSLLRSKEQRLVVGADEITGELKACMMPISEILFELLFENLFVDKNIKEKQNDIANKIAKKITNKFIKKYYSDEVKDTVSSMVGESIYETVNNIQMNWYFK